VTVLYFEEAEVGKKRTAGPYFLSKDEIIEFAMRDANRSQILTGVLSATKSTCANQKREIVLQCVNTVLVARRPAAKS
jgi:acyl dehydratase